MTSSVAAPNSVVVPLDPGVNYTLFAISNSNRIQRVTIATSGILAEFRGTAQGTSMTQNGKTTLAIPASANSGSVTLSFTSSVDGSLWELARVHEPIVIELPSGSSTTIASEDDLTDDINDTIFYILGTRVPTTG